MRILVVGALQQLNFEVSWPILPVYEHDVGLHGNKAGIAGRRPIVNEPGGSGRKAVDIRRVSINIHHCPDTDISEALIGPTYTSANLRTARVHMSGLL